MEPCLKEGHLNPTLQNQGVDKTESAENFQKFIFDLFDKNGILNDLRAYLRGHIVDVLKSAHTGNPPTCQKNFMQRLETPFQALNMLVAEYLLSLEFNYTLSVFVSEIPLANMVFDLAKSLMGLGADGVTTGLRFGENDVWSILNYLGVKCDSEHANAIVNMYKTKEKPPLLLCILKCAQLCEIENNDTVSQEGSISTNSKNSLENRSVGSQCKHDAFCKACRSRYRRVKEKYRKKKEHYIKKAQDNSKAMDVESLLKNIGELERNLVDEMFEQLKTVYESEIDMFKAEHEDKIKNSLASHARHFQQMQNELEESYKAREESLKANIVHKKRFLWGLAKALREQHSQMTKAMQTVQKQTTELSEQEKNLKLQRTEAEESLKRRAEEMKQQVADELMILEQHLEIMKAEKESINRAKSSEINVKADVKNYLNNHYHLWKEELNVLKTYIENAGRQPKVVVEKSMGTDDFKGMNNEIDWDRSSVREGRPNQVVNDLKKEKNVNFSQSKSDVESLASYSSSSLEDDRLQQCERQPTFAPASTQQPPTQLVERRHLLNRWRVLRRRISPLQVGVSLGHPVPFTGHAEGKVRDRVHSPAPDAIQNNEIQRESTSSIRDTQSKVAVASDSPVTGQKSPRSVLKEAKKKLKTVPKASASREKSPSAMLREAKRRLRKLEIEAEAVERSYMDFRRRERRSECDQPSCIPDTATKLSTHYKEESPEHSNAKLHTTDSGHIDLEKYLKKYNINFNFGQDRFRTKITAAALKNPVPEAYSEINRKYEPIEKEDFLDKPILEFRKLYYSNPQRAHSSRLSLDIQEPAPCFKRDLKEKSPAVREDKDDKRRELHKLEHNITEKEYLQEVPTKDTVGISKANTVDNNYLLVEVENVSEIKQLNNAQSDMVVVIESSAGNLDAVVAEHRDSAKQIPTKNTIVVSPKQINSKDISIERIWTPIERAKTPPVQENLSKTKEFYENDEKTSNIIESGNEAGSQLQITEHKAVFDTIQILETAQTQVNFSRTKEFFESSGEQTSRNGVTRTELLAKEPDTELKVTEHKAVFETVEIIHDYSDDFSDDVDNYKSDNNSPISLLKSSEDENFWD